MVVGGEIVQGSSQSVKGWGFPPSFLIYSAPLLPPPFFGEFSLMWNATIECKNVKML